MLAGQEGFGETSDPEDHICGLRARQGPAGEQWEDVKSHRLTAWSSVLTAAPNPPGPLSPTGGLTPRSGFVLNLL